MSAQGRRAPAAVVGAIGLIADALRDTTAEARKLEEQTLRLASAGGTAIFKRGSGTVAPSSSAHRPTVRRASRAFSGLTAPPRSRRRAELFLLARDERLLALDFEGVGRALFRVAFDRRRRGNIRRALVIALALFQVAAQLGSRVAPVNRDQVAACSRAARGAARAAFARGFRGDALRRRAERW